ncbi:MAG: methylated-DNA--[protein]-cysteine S-methyltransferase [Candidatus Wallbacteria bacterium]|nr:methylated-DNA--[protein]-cysteine S-methyltransferase [Candidatus Wallbacteria bacterium]
MSQVRFTIFDTRLGEMFVAATEKGVCNLHYPYEQGLIHRLKRDFGLQPVRDDQMLEPVKREITAYLSGTLRNFTCTVDLSQGTEFQRKAWQALLRIPYGKVRTYAWVAKECNSPKAFRAAGGACHSNPVGLIVPCHRVVGSDGSMTGFGGNSDRGRCVKLELLRMEGVPMNKDITAVDRRFLR